MDISSISIYELALLNATWLTLTVDEFKCEETERTLAKRKDADTAIKYIRTTKGCGVISKTPKVEIDGVEYFSCLCHNNFKDISIHNSLWLHNQYNKGHLAFEGCLTEQPAKYVALMMLLDQLTSEHEQRLQTKDT